MPSTGSSICVAGPGLVVMSPAYAPGGYVGLDHCQIGVRRTLASSVPVQRRGSARSELSLNVGTGLLPLDFEPTRPPSGPRCALGSSVGVLARDFGEAGSNPAPIGDLAGTRGTSGSGACWRGACRLLPSGSGQAAPAKRLGPSGSCQAAPAKRLGPILAWWPVRSSRPRLPPTGDRSAWRRTTVAWSPWSS